MLVHTVFFWLKEELSAADKEAFIDEVKTLKDISDAESVYVGTASETTARPVIDSSYDVSLTVVLKDISAHDAYQEHEIHQRFIENNASKWTKVLVYDAD